MSSSWCVAVNQGKGHSTYICGYYSGDGLIWGNTLDIKVAKCVKGCLFEKK